MENDHIHLVDENTIAAAETYRQRKTTSVLSIVFTDIANSTALREDLGERKYENLREEHDSFMASTIEDDDAGAIVKSTGDGVLAVFSEPSTAVEKLVHIQKEMAEHPLFKLRVGIDLGQVTVKSKNEIIRDVFGRQVNRSARIQALSEPGHILTSFSVYDCSVGWLKGTGLKWHHHGEAILKGFSDPVSIHEVFDPNLHQSQSNEHFNRSRYFGLEPAFSLRRIKIEYQKLDNNEFSCLFKLLEENPIKLKLIESNTMDCPESFYQRSISDSVKILADCLPVDIKALWIDDHPDNNLVERQLLHEAGLHIDLATSSEEAACCIQDNIYLLIITDIKRGNDKKAGIEFLSYSKKFKYRPPAIVYASIGGVSYFHEEAIAAGAALCTAGLITLLDGINRVLVRFVSELPRTFVDDSPVEPPKKPSLIGRFFKKIF